MSSIILIIYYTSLLFLNVLLFIYIFFRDSEADSPTCNCLAHVSDSRARIGMKNDQGRNSKYIDMLKKVCMNIKVV